MTKEERMTALTYTSTCKQVIRTSNRESRKIVWQMGVVCKVLWNILSLAHCLHDDDQQTAKSFPCKKNRSILGPFSNRWVSHGRSAHHAFFTCFVLLVVMGLSPRFHVFRAPHCAFCTFWVQSFELVHSALLGVVFCLDFGPFFFLLLFPCWVFFLYLFIYLCFDSFIKEVNFAESTHFTV
jgi:hypothetical protein